MSVKEISAGQKETRGKWYLLLKCKQLGCRHWMKEIELSWFAMARSYPPMLVHIIQKTNARGKTYKGYGVWSWSYLSSLNFISLNKKPEWEKMKIALVCNCKVISSSYMLAGCFLHPVPQMLIWFSKLNQNLWDFHIEYRSG